MKKRIQKRIIILMALSFLTGCLTVDQQKDDGEAVLINIARELPRGGEAKVEEAARWEKMDTVQMMETIKVAVVGSVDEALLQEAKPYLEQKGYGLEIISLPDYDQPNLLLEGGEIDANFFQHSAYLERYNQKQGTKLENLGAVYYEPLGIYPALTRELEQLHEGSRIAVSANPTAYARALFLLEQEGLIELAEDADLLAVWEDVTENPYGLELIKMEQAELMGARGEVELAIFSPGEALAEGLDPTNFLAFEGKDSLAAKRLSRILAVKVVEEEKIGEKSSQNEQVEESVELLGKSNESGIKKGKRDALLLLLEVLRSEEMKVKVKEEYWESIIILGFTDTETG